MHNRRLFVGSSSTVGDYYPLVTQLGNKRGQSVLDVPPRQMGDTMCGVISTSEIPGTGAGRFPDPESEQFCNFALALSRGL